MMRFEYDPKFIKLLAKEMVKEMQKVKDETKEPELITVKEAAETLNLSEDYVRKIKDKLPHVKQGNSKQGRIRQRFPHQGHHLMRQTDRKRSLFVLPDSHC